MGENTLAENVFGARNMVPAKKQVVLLLAGNSYYLPTS